MKKILFAALALIMVFSLFACDKSPSAEEDPVNSEEAESGSEVGAGEKVLNVAWVGPLTGSASRSGEELYNGAEMAFDAVGWKIGDYTVKIFKVDSESDAEKAAIAYEDCIINNDIDVGLNTWHSWVSASCIEVAAKYEIPHLLSFGASNDVKDKVNSDFNYYKYWCGKAWPDPALLVSGYVDSINSAIEDGVFNPTVKNLAIYGVDEDWGRTFCAAGKAGFEAAGWSTVVEEYFALGTTDYYAVLNKMKSAGVTLAVGTMSDVNSATSFIKQSSEVGLEALIVCDGLGWLSEWYELTGPSSDYVLDMIPQYATDTAKQFAADFETKYGYAPGPSTAALAYDTASYFIKIMNTTLDNYSELTSETIMQCWEEKVMTGECTYSMADDDAIMMPSWDYSDPAFYPDPIVDSEHYIFPVVQYFEGVAIPVFPNTMAQQELSVPESWD